MYDKVNKVYNEHKNKMLSIHCKETDVLLTFWEGALIHHRAPGAG